MENFSEQLDYVNCDNSKRYSGNDIVVFNKWDN